MIDGMPMNGLRRNDAAMEFYCRYSSINIPMLLMFD
jgi:hypothetical protein